MRRPSNYPSQKFLHTLKYQDILESNIMIKGIAIVKSNANESSRHGEQHLLNPKRTYI